MPSEYLKRDQNHVTVQGAVTDDANLDVEPWKVDPATGRLLVSAVVAGSENGKILVTGADTTYDYLGVKLVAGTGVTLTVLNPGGNETLEVAAANAQGYYELEDGGVAMTQRGIANFVNYFTLTDDAPGTRTNISINIAELEPALSLENLGGLLDLSTQVTGLLDASHIDITSLEADLDLANINGFINVSTQVTGVLPVVNGGTGVNTISGVVIADGVNPFTGVPSNVVGRVLRCTGTNTYAFGAVDLADTDAVTGVLDETNGGTGQSTISQGDLLYGSAANTISKLTKDTNATRYLSNTGTSNNPAWAQVDLTNGVTGVLPSENGGSGAVVVTDVTVFEDFLSSTSLVNGVGDPVQFFPFGRFVNPGSSTAGTLTSEQNHPGIITFRESDGQLFLFTDDGDGTRGGIALGSDFDLEIGTRCVYNGSANQNVALYEIVGGVNCFVSVNGTSALNSLSYDILGTTGTTTIPASNTWFKIRFQYISGTLNLYIDGILINSATASFGAAQGHLEVTSNESGAGTMSVGVDYTKLNYQVTR